MNCTEGEGLVGDVSESFGHLDCILCLANGDKMDSMVNIGRGKFFWITTRRLLKLRTLFGVKSGDSRSMNTSGRCNKVS